MGGYKYGCPRPMDNQSLRERQPTRAHEPAAASPNMPTRLLALSLVLVAVEAQYLWSIPCRTPDQCTSVLGPSQLYQCHQGFCFCANPSSPSHYELCSNTDAMLGAVRASGLRRNCTTHADCEAVNGANCLPKDDRGRSVKICLCRADMVESADGQRCLPAVEEIGGNCLEDAQCRSRLKEGAECVGGQCRCRSTHHEGATRRCVRNLGYGEHCKLEEDGCYQANSPHGENLLACTESYGCRCKKYWTYNEKSQHCEFSGAAQVMVQLSTMSALILFIAFF